MIEGGDSPEYVALEDSLRRFASGFRPEGRRAPRPDAGKPARRRPPRTGEPLVPHAPRPHGLRPRLPESGPAGGGHRRLRPRGRRRHRSRPPRRARHQGGVPGAARRQPRAAGGRVPRRDAQLGRARQPRPRPGAARSSCPGSRSNLRAARGAGECRRVRSRAISPRWSRGSTASPASPPSRSISPAPTPAPAGSSSAPIRPRSRGCSSCCRGRTRKPLVAKLSPALPDIAGMALVARDAGADGVSVVNTLPGYLDGRGRQPRLGNGNGGVSGPALLPIGRPGGAADHGAQRRDAGHRRGRHPNRRRCPAVPAGRRRAGRHRHRRRWPTRGFPERVVADLERRRWLRSSSRSTCRRDAARRPARPDPRGAVGEGRIDPVRRAKARRWSAS